MVLHAALVVVQILATVPSVSTPRLQVTQYEDAKKLEISDLITEAKETIKDRALHHKASVAIQKLAILRATKAVDFLVENIAFQPLAGDVAFAHPPSLAESLPCVHALSEIGSPCFAAVLNLAEKETREVFHNYVAVIFVDSLGKELAIVYLNHYASKLKDADKKHRIESVVKIADRLTTKK